MWSRVVNPLHVDDSRPACRWRAALHESGGCAGVSDECVRHKFHRASWRLHAGVEDGRPRTTFYRWGARGAHTRCSPPEGCPATRWRAAPSLVRCVSAPGCWAGRPHQLASVGRIRPSVNQPSLLSDARVSGSPRRERRPPRDSASARSVISGPRRQSRCDGAAARR
jgi:hypothetical protein